MRWNLNSRQAVKAKDLKSHLEIQKGSYLLINYERPEDKLTVAERADYATKGALISAEMTRAIQAASDLAEEGGEGNFLASLSAYEYPDGRRSMTISVDQADLVK